MIFTILLEIVYFFVSTLIHLLPTGGTFPQEWFEAIAIAWSYLNAFSFLLPTAEYKAAALLIFGYELFKFFWWVFHWVFRKVPVANIK